MKMLLVFFFLFVFCSASFSLDWLDILGATAKSELEIKKNAQQEKLLNAQIQELKSRSLIEQIKQNPDLFLLLYNKTSGRWWVMKFDKESNFFWQEIIDNKFD